jgi:hypothetical protein
VSRLELNLARRPFLNRRPVVRAAVALSLAGAALFAWNLWLYGHFLVGSGEKARRLAELESAIAGERAAAASLGERISGLDLPRQNATVRFLNGKIAERTFSWGLLLDRLAAALPADARLISLGQETAKKRGQSADEPTAAPAGEGGPAMRLRISGEAETDEALLALVDGLFAHPEFRQPDLQREVRQEGQGLRFDLAVGYLPQADEAEEVQ